jgi:tRNA U34 5-methylaminomethyl-2-thiouridine-forming methyltransferase MnmC
MTSPDKPVADAHGLAFGAGTTADGSPPPDGLTWRDGVPVSVRFDDPYYSLAGGLDETAHVFLAGNGLPGRFRDGFRIAELGFGTGLNLLVTMAAWRAAGAPGRLFYTSFEAFPMSPEDRARALAVWPTLAPDLARLDAAGSGDLGEGVRLTIIEGDARQTLPGWAGQADAWFLDGFSPAKNPEMWGPDLMAAVAAHLTPGGTLATYTAAGHVRRALAAAGLEVTRTRGYGRKRHMTVARKPP